MSIDTKDILAHFEDESLSHYGVKGMRWGVRKDRRKGSGRPQKGSGLMKKKVVRRKAVDKASSNQSSQQGGDSKPSTESNGLKEGSSAKPTPSKTKKDAPVNTKKPMRRMDNDELRRATERLEAETRYVQAKARHKRTTTASGKMAGWMADTTKDIVTDVTKNSFKKLGNEILSEALGVAPTPPKKKKKN